MTKNTQLAHGQITNQDEITVMLVEPTDGALVRVQRPRGNHHKNSSQLPGCSSGDHTDHRRL